jgi:hypothetical protein
VTCPDCGGEMDEEPWWDDAPENGGQCIGSIWTCPKKCPNGVEYE